MRLLVCWLLVALAPAARARECETMKVPFCEKMPYQDTRLPNLFGHTTQGEVNKALEPLQDLRDSGCFGHYSFVLCSALAPPCMADMQQPAPCRHVCERARERCYGLMLMFNVTEAWPDCDLLPRHGADSLCLSPTTLTPRDNCHCLKKHHQPKPTTDLMDKKDYDYAIKARMEGFAPSHFPSILSVTVLDIFRDGIVEQTKNNVTFIRTNTSCKCPELESGKEYLIMGYEDFDRNELLLGKKSYVAPWSDQVALDYGNEASRNYQDSSSRTYSQRYGNYVRHHGYSMGFHRPSFTTLMMAGGAYALYRHYSNKKKLGKVYGYPGYGGYGSSFGALGGGGFGALGNPRGKYTNFNTVGAAPAYGNYGYNNYNNYNSFGRPGSQVPSYPITHKPNYATSKPDFVNRNRNPSYPVTQKPYRTSSGSRSTSSRSGSSSRSSRRSSSSRRSWGRRTSGSRRRSWGTRSRLATTWRPKYQVTTRRPSYPATTQRPNYPATTRRPYYPPTTRKPYYPPTTRRPYYPPTTRRPYYPPTTRRPSYRGSSRRTSSRRTSSRRGRYG